MIQKSSYVLMKLEPRIILKSFLNISDFEPQYILINFILIKKECIRMKRTADTIEQWRFMIGHLRALEDATWMDG